MAHHDPKACEKVPYTAYYSNNNWSCQFRCPVCAMVCRKIISFLGHYEMVCDGRMIDVLQPDQQL